MRVVKLLFLSIILFASGCSGVKGVGGYKPPILPLRVSADTNGNISFELETEIEYPTPLGTFSAGVVVDPKEYFNRNSTLTVRVDCQDNFYDLHGRDFSIDFESGYYEKISLAKRGTDILLDLRRIGAESVTCLIPTVEQNPNGSSSDNTDSEQLKLDLINDRGTSCSSILSDAENQARLDESEYEKTWNIDSCVTFTLINPTSKNIIVHVSGPDYTRIPSLGSRSNLCENGDVITLKAKSSQTFICDDNSYMKYDPPGGMLLCIFWKFENDEKIGKDGCIRGIQ